MTTYISILRGINVGGQKRVLMADLKALYERLGFSGVVTYIQSGNVLFKSGGKADTGEHSRMIENAIAAQYPFTVPVIVRTQEEMQSVIAGNPFPGESGIDPEKLHVTFLGALPDAAQMEKIKTYNYPPDRFVIAGREVYLHCPVDYGNSKLSNTFFESKLKVTATTRNWKTVQKLLELAGG